MIPHICGGLVVVLGLLVLLGWWGDIDWLTQPLAGQVAMKANTAGGFVLAGLSLLFLVSERRLAAPLSKLFAATLLLCGVITLSTYFGLGINIDSLLVDAAANRSGLIPARMAPTTAVCFVLLALALIADHGQNPLWRYSAKVFAATVMVIGFVNVIGYLYGAPRLLLGSTTVEAMDVHTAAGFVIAAIGSLVNHPRQSVIALLFQTSVTSAHFRALVLASVVLPVAIGALALMGHGEYYSAETAVGLTATGCTIAMALFVTATHLLLNRSQERQQVGDRAMAAVGLGIVITDHNDSEEPIIYANPAFYSITGYPPGEVLGKNCRFLNADTENAPETIAKLREAIQHERPCELELNNRRKNSDIFINHFALAPVRDSSGRVSHFVGIIDDITLDKDRELQLEKTLFDLNRTTESMESFVRILSHELRGPLNVAATWISLIEMDASPAHVKQGTSAIRQSIEDQTRLIEDLVDATRAASPKLKLELEALDLGELLHDIASEWRPRFREKSQQFELDIAREPTIVLGDTARLRQIFGNLLSNAMKYTPKGGSIRLTTRRAHNDIEVRVTDDGNGIDPTAIDQIFEPYWRGDRTVKGLGLGLPIVKSLVIGHGGHIAVSSDGVGKGTTFTVRLAQHGESEA
ncbi:MAG: PAS domain S-box-containing protein [Gammaproteobacteria bacterium]|jgi:PAS domain S-box-containing protein